MFDRQRLRLCLRPCCSALVLCAAAACSTQNDHVTGDTSQPSIGASAGSGGRTTPSSGAGGASAVSMPATMTAAGGSGGTQQTGGSGGVRASQHDAGSADAGKTSDAGANMQADAGVDAPACDKHVTPSTDCSAMLAPGDERTCMIGAREYIVYAGKTLNLCQPTALVIDAHGATETDKQQAGEDEFCTDANTCWHGLGSGWKAEADTPGGGFIAVFPQGEDNMWSDTDADFMVQIVSEVQKVADVDPKKVYISGISNGGLLTYWTGCPHSDLFHGMSPNSGGGNCTSVAKPIPVIAFDDMPDFAYQGSVDAVNTMVMLDNCKGGPKDWVTVDSTYKEAVCRSAKEDVMATLIPCNEVTMPIEPTTCKVWDQCDDDVQVVFCEVAASNEHGAGNEALDGHIIYENNTLLNTPSLAWRFFKQFW